MALFLMVALDHQPRPLVLGPVLSGALVVLGHLLRPWLKMSLHVSFAVFAASFLWPSMVGTFVILTLAIAISWSRLALARHTRREVIIALLAGTITSATFPQVVEGHALNYAEALETHKVKNIYLATYRNIPAAKFYEKNGFTLDA
jgi:GNAT superfamily N-acetyltransferase